MHEYSIVQALFERVAAEARTRRATAVHRLSIRIGELSGVEPDLLTTAYETFRTETICAGAALDLRVVPARWTCPGCGRGFDRGDVLRCAACGVPARLAGGDEIMLDRIEMEVP
ncbi:MAG: hydrogenase nickel incorporation protein HypA [Acidobacteria bacterium RIFCSPLOWO2_02_FULL_68_18]|nr:MAG: hydrogenase nickel incorporation protein HypA [Acidobacteria bacterium RIFCSPLOWO2_02_FULL_68_18]OFW48688.1 MAG: hydrogenase nickel incorporation protein HypA [Acidobacteria bacterium RIFCSPLOWO2_12_FULL_68_19]